MNEQKVTIVLSGKRFDLDVNNKESIQKIPWKDRKQLIDLLETIKQAEHIKPRTEPQPDMIHKEKVHTERTQNKTLATAEASQVSMPDSVLDPEIKPSEGDIDSMMERFIMEGQKDRPKVPDKSSIYKGLLIVMAVMIILSLVF